MRSVNAYSSELFHKHRDNRASVVTLKSAAWRVWVNSTGSHPTTYNKRWTICNPLVPCSAASHKHEHGFVLFVVVIFWWTPDGTMRSVNAYSSELFHKHRDNRASVVTLKSAAWRVWVNSTGSHPTTYNKRWTICNPLVPCSAASVLKFHSSYVPHMMTSPNGKIFRVTGHLCGEFTCHRWIPHTKASDAEFWCFLWSAPE